MRAIVVRKRVFTGSFDIAKLDTVSDRAVTEFRGFESVGIYHAQTVRDSQALNNMIEIIDRLQKALQERKKML